MSNEVLTCSDAPRLKLLNEHLDGGDKDQVRQPSCNKHNNEAIKYYCRTCDVLVCKECVLYDHPKGLHDHENVLDAAPKLVSQTPAFILFPLFP